MVVSDNNHLAESEATHTRRTTMSIRTASVFSQLLSLIPLPDVARHVRDLKADCHSKGLSCWGQFVAMLFCQRPQAKSLREIKQGLRSCLVKLHMLLDHFRAGKLK